MRLKWGFTFDDGRFRQNEFFPAQRASLGFGVYGAIQNLQETE